MPGERILVLDDNPLNLKLVQYFLQAKGYDVRTATSAEEALTVLGTFHPRILLLDVQLPGMNGLDLARLLRADPANKDILLFAVTANAMKGDREKALEAGCDDYFAKPVDRKAILAAIEKALA